VIEALLAIQEELRRLKQEGVDHVSVHDETLAALGAPIGQKSPPATKVSEELAELAQDAASSDSKLPAPATKVTQASQKPLPGEAPRIELPNGEPDAQMEWLRKRVENCPVCLEHLNDRGKIVFGTGDVQADIFFCGEAPGADEELKGEPFVGKAGELLTKIIRAMGLTREAVYIANILKWRPEHDKPYGNRPPTIEEMRFCLPYLEAQLTIVQPKVIIALGNTAVTGLLGPDPTRKMGAIRGKWQDLNGTPLMVTFHPSYLLRAESQANPNAKKRQVWEDMLQVMEKVGLPISEKQRGFFTSRR